jgi:hypothetical protein
MLESLISAARPFLLVLGFFALSVFMALYLNSDFRQGYKAKFKVDLKKAILNTQPSWEQVLLLARSHNLAKGEAYFQVIAILRDLLTGDDKELQPHREIVERYLSEYATTDPFDGIPSETRLHLSRLRDALADKEHLLEPLTIQLKELVSIYERKQKAQRAYTSWGFFIAVLSLGFAAYTYVNPSPSSPRAAQAKAAAP